MTSLALSTLFLSLFFVTSAYVSNSSKTYDGMPNKPSPMTESASFGIFKALFTAALSEDVFSLK